MKYIKAVPQEDGSIEYVETDEPQTYAPALPIETPYTVKRANEYPPLGDQLDMLWHAMDLDPSKRVEPFYTTIKTIKEKYPKP